MDVVKNIITNVNFIGTIISVLFFLLLGFFLKRKNIITDENQKIISFLALDIAVPAMAFNAFMCDFNKDEFLSNLWVIVIGTLLYVIFLVSCKLIYHKKGKEDSKIFAIIASIGQVTLFSMPIIEEVYDEKEAVLPINLLSIVFRLFLYIYAYCTFSGFKITKDNVRESLKKVFISPVMIATFLGLFIWITQGFMFKVTISDQAYSILRVDKTLPYFYKIVTYGSHLVTPLCMILIGSSLGNQEIKGVFKNKEAWGISILRTVVIPLICIVIVFLLNLLPFINLDKFQFAALIIGFAAPVSAVVNTYAIKYNREAYTASSTCFLTTFMCVITYPILFIIVELIGNII